MCLEKKMVYYPCCPDVGNGVFYKFHGHRFGSNRTLECLIEQQHCLQSVLQLGADYVRDVNASLFLSATDVKYEELAPGPDGRLVYLKTGIAPCILHFNSDGTAGNLSRNAWRMPAWTWAPLKVQMGVHRRDKRQFRVETGGGTRPWKGEMLWGSSLDDPPAQSKSKPRTKGKAKG